MKKYFWVLLPISILILISALLFVYCYKETNILSEYVSYEDESALLKMVNDQKDINSKLDEISKNKKYTIDNPYIKLNPYEISPLSAIIIFTTNDNISIDVYINDKLMTKMDEAKVHNIPIYGLLEDYENKITLKANNKSYEYTIKTEKSNLKYPLKVEKSYETDDLIFTVASLSTYLTAWDYEGNLRFYLKANNRMDVEWLSNGHFLIGTTEGENREQFIGLMEMDYLGKIYNYYTLENGYSFEMQILKDGSIMVAGGDKAVYFDHQVVYDFNPSSGKVNNLLDIYDIVKEIDPDFNDKYLGPSAIRNGFYYDEATKELVVSFRDINTLMSFNYKTKKLNWVFTDCDLFDNSVWDNYKINLKSGRYPLGQHSPQIIDGKLALFNNGYDRYNVTVLGNESNVSKYKNAYSSAEIYSFKGNDAYLDWSYNYNKQLFSIKYGLFRVLDNGNKLIDFGYVLKNDFRNNYKNTIVASESDPTSMYSLLLELDKNNNIIYQARCGEGKYRIFKHSLYNDTTSNTSYDTLNIYNTITNDELSVKSYKEYDLKNASEWINSLNFTKNTFVTDYDFKENDQIDLLFMDQTGRVYILNYKDKNNKTINRIFNVNLNGKYTLFIKINNTLYNPKKIIDFN